MIKKSLIYRTDGGSEIKIDDTILNRIKARLRGFKLVCSIDWGKSQDGK